MPRQMNLALFHSPVGGHGAWRLPGSGVETLYSLAEPVSVARRAEGAKLDAFVCGESLVYGGSGRNPPLGGYEPLTLTAALASVTSRIGLIATLSTTFNQPYHIARQLCAIDHMSQGRAGWNIVTSRAGEENFGSELPARDDRYARADEFLQVATRLWDGWQADAIINDRTGGVWAEDSKIGGADFEGAYFSVKGPLALPRSPQGRPALFQAGQSGAGRALGARWADVVYTAQTELEAARAFRSDMIGRIVRQGRDPNRFRVMPGLAFVFGDTLAEAEAMEAELVRLSGEKRAISDLAREMGGIDLSDLSLHDPIPAKRLITPEEVSSTDNRDRALFFQGSTSRYINHYQAAIDGAPIARLLRNRGGHLTMVGTPRQIAEDMMRWFSEGACDGFIVAPRYAPAGLSRFLDDVVPILQSAGMFRKDYDGSTLQEVIFGAADRAATVD